MQQPRPEVHQYSFAHGSRPYQIAVDDAAVQRRLGEALAQQREEDVGREDAVREPAEKLALESLVLERALAVVLGDQRADLDVAEVVQVLGRVGRGQWCQCERDCFCGAGDLDRLKAFVLN